mmetsp:Transcript_2909/g.8721  ORF Transcript_2909/g.8721 Transcript_2909/m.8721 type:complete len:305 (-) Transcript_2909:913-1827(-)
MHEEARRDRLAHLGVVLAARGDLELVTVHDRQQLLAHVLRAAHRARLDEVFKAPRVGELGVRPRLVDGEVGHVVALGLEELGALRVCLRLLLLGAVPDVLDGEHRDDGEDLVGRAHVDRGDQDLGEGRLERELGHAAAEAREEAFVVERRERVEALHGGDERLHRRRVHKVKVEQVVDAHRLHLQHGVAQIGALDLGHGRGQHLVLVRRLGVEPVALARAGASRAAGALPRGRLRDGHHDQRVHAHLCVVALLLDEARVDHVVDAVDCEGRLRNVGRHHDLARAGWRGVEDLGLHLRREGRVDG